MHLESLVVTPSLLLPILLLTGSNNLLNLALICHNLYFQEHITINRETPCKTWGHSRAKQGRNKTMIKSTFHLPQ